MGGEFWELYDLSIDVSDQDEDESTVLPEMVTEDFNEEKSVPLDAGGGVKRKNGAW